MCLNVLRGEVHNFHSADTAVLDDNDNGNFQYPVEYLNSVNGSGLPLSNLKLKIGAPIMILWNLDPAAEVCDGTHAISTKCTRRVSEARMLGVTMLVRHSLYHAFLQLHQALISPLCFKVASVSCLSRLLDVNK